MSSCAKHKKHPYSPNLGNLQNHFLPAENQLDGLPEGTNSTNSTSARLPHVAIEAKNLSQHQEELWEGRENADELPPALPCRLWSGLRTDFGRWGTWDVEAIGIDSYGYGSIPIDTFLVGWTSIYQLFWGSLGSRVLTHPHIGSCFTQQNDPQWDDGIFTWDFWNSKWHNFTWLLHNYPWPAFGVLCFPTLLPAVPSRNHSWIYARVPVESADITMVPRKEI